MAVGDRKRGKGEERETIYAGYSWVGVKNEKEILGRMEQSRREGNADLVRGIREEGARDMLKIG